VVNPATGECVIRLNLPSPVPDLALVTGWNWYGFGY
jgi:hypothetical protein